MQDRKLGVLLRCIVAREADADGWSSHDALGFGGNRAVTTAIRDAFSVIVPDAFDVIEGDRRGNSRLNLWVEVEHVDWEALLAHPDPGVRKVAAE
jgi:hypothetical protein